MNYNFYKLYVIKYIMIFKNVTPKESQILINNKNRIFDMKFKTPERLNKYRSDKNIYNEVKQNKKLKDYDNIFHENLDKYLLKTMIKRKLRMFLNIIMIQLKIKKKN